MDTATELKNTSDIVKVILQRCPDARNSDDFLYLKVCEYVNGTHISLPFWKVLQDRKYFGYPPFESVRRSRQKLQSTYPELASSKVVEAKRTQNEKIYEEFARGTI
jgi:hypothetical protein